MTPIFWGPLKIFISNNILTSEYAGDVSCPVYVMGSDADKTLDSSLQKKVANCFENSELIIFSGINHEDYFVSSEVIEYIAAKMNYDTSPAAD